MSNQPKTFFNPKRILLFVAVLFVVCISAFVIVFKWYSPDLLPGGNATSVPITVAGADNTRKPLGDSGGTSQGKAYQMKIALSEGQAAPQAYQPLPVVTGEPLSPAELEQLLARLPALPTAIADQSVFNRPAESLPAPRPGVTIPQTFPPLEVSPTPAQSAPGPLNVLRFAPEGDVPVAPFVSITFDQPMVPLGTLADLAALDVPARIEPALPGTWRWLGTKTLTFQADSALIDRLPKATEYRVTVPQGTKSILGGELAQTVSWVFTTPPPQITLSYPNDTPQPLQPLFFIAFDQRIDPASVLATLRVTAAGQVVSLQLANTEEIQKDQVVSQMVKNAPEGRWLVFCALKPFATQTQIEVTVGPGTPSAEGPRLTTTAQSFRFSTYAPLTITAHRCAWYDDRCPPLSPFFINFNNNLDPEAFTEDLLSVSPEIPGVHASVYGNTIQIDGQTRGRTTYTVILSRKIRDVFGQTLGQDARLTFKVDSADPLLSGPDQAFITLDPSAAKAVFSVYAINYKKLELQISAVQPEDWKAYKEYLRSFRQTDVVMPLPGKLLVQKSLNLNLTPDELSQVDVDLSQYMNGSSGQFVVQIAPPKGLFENDQAHWNRLSQTVLTWVQVTQIGLDAYIDHSSMLAWVTNLKDGSPLSGVSLQDSSGTLNTVSTADGTARFDIPNGATYLLARQGNDQAMLPRSSSAWDDEPWSVRPPADQLRWYVFDDRQMYRPGEDVHIKGWLRQVGGRQDGDVTLVGQGINAVSYRIADPQGNDLGTGRATVNALGGFDLLFSLPANTNLGSAQLFLTAEGSLGGLDGAYYTHMFQIQEFRRPEFEVTARTESTGPYFAGGQALVAVDAKYYAGGGLPNADVTWNVTTTPTNYSPPNWPDYIFGSWRPWWFFDYGGPDTSGVTETFTGKTDAAGTHYLQLKFDQQGDPALEPRPHSVQAQSTVMDVNRQAWSSSTNLLVHPADVYIGLKSERTFVEQGKPLSIEYIVPDLDGKPQAGLPVQISAARLEWKYKAGSWSEQEEDVQVCNQTSSMEPGTCVFDTKLGGTYQITAQVTDSQGRINQTRFTRWVSGGKRPPSRKVEQEVVTLIPDQQTYAPGQTAQVLVQSPFSPAEGLLTVSRSGILYTKRFRIEADNITLEIPIESAHIPNLEIQVDLVGSAPRVADDGITPLPGIPARAAYATGTLHLSIPPLQRTLALQVTPDETKLEPGAQTTLTVVVKDANGQPVPDAELAVVVVDEAILALSNYQLADPLSIFYADRPSWFGAVYSRSSLVLADPMALAQQLSKLSDSSDSMLRAGAPMATMMPAMEAAPSAPGAKSDAGQSNVIAVRSDFNPLALFSPTLHTGLDGTARVPVKVPDNLTRYRVMVVAVDTRGSSFGTGESSLTARLPLMVRPSAPRFLNFGDQFELPVVIQNQTDTPLLVSVVARASNLQLLSEGLKLTVPANDRVEVRFPARSSLAGTARIQIAASAGSYADAAVVALPVYTPSTSEAFATYGVIDQGVTAQPVHYPSGVFAQYGGLEISTSSTAVQALTDAVLYLQTYPYQCSEQVASRLLAIAALRDVLTAFKAEGLPAPEVLQTQVAADIERLAGMQNSDGGFPYWQRGFESSPFNTIHVAHALARAELKGYSVPSGMKQMVLAALRNIENYYPDWYGLQTRRSLSAYALYVRNLWADRDSLKAHNLLAEAGLDGFSLNAIGWLWPVIDDQAQLTEIRRFIANRVVETPGAANFTESYDDQNYLLLGSDRRTDAILLDALMGDNPKSDLIPKLVNGLLAHRTKGRWGNTQENVFVLLALDKYFNTYEAQTPDFVARLWLGNTYAGSSEFRGRTTELHQTNIPMADVLSETAAAGGTQNLILSKEGPGRLYYRLGLRYAPTSLKLDPLDMGFVVSRRYEAVDDPQDVTRAADGSWVIKAGARVRVKLSMVADNRRYHVALVDPLPAGLEIVNPSLAVSGNVPQNPTSPDYRYGWWWWGTWYEHQNLRDDRAEAFSSLLWEGVYEYSYVARATTPGTFIVPPAKAEEMYSPEVFGRTGSDLVIIK
ncbi:MAG: Ig-like domain-containing protein [Chloroflexota bacterium]